MRSFYTLYSSFDEHANLDFDFINKSQVLCKSEKVLFPSYYISYSSYLDKWGPYDKLFISLGILARNKEYKNFSSKDGMEKEHHLFYILNLCNFNLL
jgi:hypothetical protein